MGSTVLAVMTEEELRKEIDELYRQQREITERLRDPKGIRRGGQSGAGPRNFAANGGRQRDFVPPVERNERNDAEDQPPAKKRLSSAVVKVEDGEIVDEGSEGAIDVAKNDAAIDIGLNANAYASASRVERRPSSWSGRNGNQRPSKMDFEIPPPAPRVLPKNEDPSLVSRNKRMLGQLLGTLERFRKEDKQLSGTEAYMRRSDSLKRAEQRAREESEKLRQQEREQISEKRKRDLTLRARIAAKAEEKKLELIFLRWIEHHKKLGNFIRLFLILVQKCPYSQFIDIKISVDSCAECRSSLITCTSTTKTEPPIYYMFSKPLDQDSTLTEEQKGQMFQEWKASRREELSQYQKQVADQYVVNAEKEQDRWQNGRKGRRGNNVMANLQETMDKELETHQLEHGPKIRKIPGQSNNEIEDEDDVEDINTVEDDMMDDVLGVDENVRRDDEMVKVEEGNDGTLHEDKKDD